MNELNAIFQHFTHVHRLLNGQFEVPVDGLVDADVDVDVDEDVDEDEDEDGVLVSLPPDDDDEEEQLLFPDG